MLAEFGAGHSLDVMRCLKLAAAQLAWASVHLSSRVIMISLFLRLLSDGDVLLARWPVLAVGFRDSLLRVV